MDLSHATVGQLLIPVDNFDRGVAFYRDTLGFTFLFSAPPQMAFLMCGDVRLLIGVMPEGQPAQRGSTVYFKVDDIHGIASSLKTKGVNFASEPHRVHRTATSALWLAEFEDPDGNHLALMCELAVAAA